MDGQKDQGGGQNSQKRASASSFLEAQIGLRVSERQIARLPSSRPMLFSQYQWPDPLGGCAHCLYHGMK